LIRYAAADFTILLAIQENTPKINPEITPTIGPVTHIIRLGCAAIMSARGFSYF